MGRENISHILVQHKFWINNSSKERKSKTGSIWALRYRISYLKY